MASSNSPEILDLTAQIVSAHVKKNSVQADSLPALIQQVFQTLEGLGKEAAEPEKLVPAVPVKQSVKADYLVCLEDGKKMKMLKRHLKTAYNMTPEQYRQKWGLPNDYPMTSPNYAEHRSALAKQIGLGTKRGTDVEAPQASAGSAELKSAAASRASRSRKAA
jgi:predicted transcriptional regulator